MQTPGLSTSSPSQQTFREALRRGQLLLPRCQTCGEQFYPLKTRCPRCGSTALEWAKCSGRGRIYSYLINYKPSPASLGELWDVMVVVEMEEGPRVLAPLVGAGPDPSVVKVDMPVRLASQGDGKGGPAFELA